MHNAASPATDSKSSKSGTQSGGVTFGATGKIGSATAYDGTNDYLNFGNIVVPTTGTASVWWKPDETVVSGTARHPILRFYIASPLKIFDLYDYDGILYAGWYNNGVNKRVTWTLSGISSGTWYYVTLAWTNGGNTTLYINGVQKGTATTSPNATFDTSTATNHFGRDNVEYAKMTGDETRFASAARTTDWMITEYNNQNAPATYQTLGGEVSLNTTDIANNLTISAGTLDLNGEGISVGTTFSNDNGTLKMIGDETVTLTNDSTHGTIEYSATSGTRSIKNMTYNNISISGSGGTYTLPGTITVNATLSIASGAIFSLGGQNLTLATLSNNGTFKLQGAETVAITTFDTNSGTVEYVGTSSYSSLILGDSYYGLKLNGSGGSWTLDANLAVAEVLNIAAGTLSAADKTVTLSGSGTPFVVVGTFTKGTSTIEYTGGSATNVSGTNYYNLKVNQAGTTFTAASNISIVNVFTIQAGEFDASSRTLTLYGSGNCFVNSGTFTPSTSSVLYSSNSSANVSPVTYNNLSFGDGGSLYKRAVSVTNSTGSTLTDYQIKVSLTTSNFSFANSTSDGHDLRVKDLDNITDLNYYIESWDQSGQTATVWVKIPSISTSGTTIYFNYGNDALVAQSDASMVFDLYDPFDNLDAWTVTGTTVSVASGVATLDSGSSPKIYRTFSIPQPFIVEAKYQRPSNYRNRMYLTTSAGGIPTGYDYGDFSPSIFWNGFTGTTLSSDTWYTVRWDATTSDYTWKIIDGAGTEVLSRSFGSSISNLTRLEFSGTENTSSDLKLDWVQIRKYASTEPGATVGSETNAAGDWTFTGNATVSGNLTIANGTVLASTYTIGVGGNWSNTATFTPGTSTVTLNGSGVQAITGGNFNNLTVTNASASGVSFADSASVAATFTAVTASSKVTFLSGGTYAFNALNINGQAVGTRVTLTSSTPASAWNLNITEASPVASNVSVRDSNANKDVDATTGGDDATGNTHWLFPAPSNSAPTNDSLTFTNPYSSNVAVADDTTSWTFRALVTDTDGPTNLTTVDIGFANSADSATPYNSLRYRWTEATDTFSEVYDTQTAGTITSTSADSNAVGNQWTLDFKIKFNSSFAATDTQYAVELYAVDDSAATDTDNYVNKFQVTPLFVTLAVDSPTLAFGSLIPGNVLTGTTIVTISTNFGNGYSLAASDGITGSDSTLLHQIDLSTRVTDYTGTITTPTLWTGSGLGICLFAATGKESKWGTGVSESDSNNKYAGVPENATAIHAKTGSPTTDDANSIGYKLVVPITQKTGDYQGDVTYTATGALE